MTENFFNRKIAEIIKTKPEEFLEVLEIELSPSRIKCALLGFSALKKSLYDFASSAY
jgi:NifU-like protein involved in Fe-S cluster formation